MAESPIPEPLREAAKPPADPVISGSNPTRISGATAVDLRWPSRLPGRVQRRTRAVMFGLINRLRISAGGTSHALERPAILSLIAATKPYNWSRIGAGTAKKIPNKRHGHTKRRAILSDAVDRRKIWLSSMRMTERALSRVTPYIASNNSAAEFCDAPNRK